MKKVMIALVCVLAIAGCKQKQGQVEGSTDGADSVMADSLKKDSVVAQTVKYSPEDIEVDWANKDIPVEKGGKTPDVTTLVQAFNQVWPTETVNQLLEYAKDPKFTKKFSDETGGAIVVDRKNGFVENIHGDAPSDNFVAAMWKRKDGHRLFMINLIRPNQEDAMKVMQAICAYDYEPNTQTLKPERNAIIRFRQTAGVNTIYHLPQEGKDISIEERDKDYTGTFHIFAWDGQVFSKESTFSEKKLGQLLNGTWKCLEENKPMLTFKIISDEESLCTITNCGISGSTEYEVGGNANDGFLHLFEVSGSGDDVKNPSIKCKFKLSKDGKLRGTYYLRQNGGKELKGEMTLEKESELSQYAE